MQTKAHGLEMNIKRLFHSSLSLQILDKLLLLKEITTSNSVYYDKICHILFNFLACWPLLCRWPTYKIISCH